MEVIAFYMKTSKQTSQSKFVKYHYNLYPKNKSSISLKCIRLRHLIRVWENVWLLNPFH